MAKKKTTVKKTTRALGPSALGTEIGSALKKMIATGTETGSLTGVWSRLGTEIGGHRTKKPGPKKTGTETLRLEMLPGTHEEIKPGEQRTMKVSLKKAKSKGKTILRLSLEG